MKSPAELAERLAREWANADVREARLLRPEVWPVERTIGRPAASLLIHRLTSVRDHIRAWRNVAQGEVVWEAVRYRGLSEPLDIPVAWRFHGPEDWVAASGDALVRLEFDRLQGFQTQVDRMFHRVLIRQRSLWRDRSDQDVLRAATVALDLSPGCAEGRPLRTISRTGIDSKFFERHRALMVALLDERFDGRVSELGLESFLGAMDEGDHWLLVVPLDRSLLPFGQLRVRARELAAGGLPGRQLLIVENEQCVHVLPEIADTVAVLGSGLNLSWLGSEHWRGRRIGYWGDMDTWGLHMLSVARGHQPQIDALLMDAVVFHRFAEGHAVREPSPASEMAPIGLTRGEAMFYSELRQRPLGRLEQEFLPASWSASALLHWGESPSAAPSA
jgi:hypothetical protein